MQSTRRNRQFGWWSLLTWLSLGMVLEALHGFKIGWYLDVVNDARRLQLSLAHSHGTLLALVNLAFAATVQGTAALAPQLARAGFCLRWAALLMPAGFLGGGLFPMGPDPGFLIVLVPIGGLLLFVGVLQAALAARAEPAEDAVGAVPEPRHPSPSELGKTNKHGKRG